MPATASRFQTIFNNFAQALLKEKDQAPEQLDKNDVILKQDQWFYVYTNWATRLAEAPSLTHCKLINPATAFMQEDELWFRHNRHCGFEAYVEYLPDHREEIVVDLRNPKMALLQKQVTDSVVIL